MSDIATNWQIVSARLREAEIKYQRDPHSVTLVAVSKTHDIGAISAAIAAGQLVFAESYVQEALPKIEALARSYPSLEWHYIGRMQSSKSKYLARHFAWVQSVTKKEHAEQLNKYRAENLPPLNICLEVNLSAEDTKAALALSDVLSLAQAVAALPRLHLRGLMAIPAPSSDFATQFATFRRLADMYYELQNCGFAVDTLSIGMSDDYVAAIAAGSTMVRIGAAIFGARRVC